MADFALSSRRLRDIEDAMVGAKRSLAVLHAARSLTQPFAAYG
jgi:hypothetical protein